MRTINLAKEHLSLEEVIQLAQKEPVLLLTSDGREFLISEADDFEREVQTLRGSQAFQRFLDERTASKSTTPLEEIEKEIERELAKSEKTS